MRLVIVGYHVEQPLENCGALVQLFLPLVQAGQFRVGRFQSLETLDALAVVPRRLRAKVCASILVG